MRYTRTAMQMRIAAERACRARTAPLSPPDPSRRPLRASEEEADAASAWLAHVQAGRIPVR